MWKTLAFVVSAIALPRISQAASGITYDCDTAAGHFSELVLPAPASTFSVTGNIRVNAIAKDKKWAPLARVRISSAPAAPGSPPSAYGGFKITALPGKSVSMPVEIVQALSFDTAGRDEEMIASTIQESGAVQPFRLTFDGRSVAIAIGSDSRSYPLAASQPVVQVICSTGEFLITDLKLEPSN